MTPKDFIDQLLAPLVPEEIQLKMAEDYLKTKYPGAPVKLALRYARGATDSLAGVDGGALTRRVILQKELERAERYLQGLITFYKL